MSTAPLDHRIGTTAPSGAARLLRGWTPLHAWSRRRRAAVAGAIATVACALAALACIAADFAGAEAADAALAAVRLELADARRAQSELPALRRAAASTVKSGSSDTADQIRIVSELAAATGISLVSLEPGAPGAQAGKGDESFRLLKLSAQGDFMQLRSFVRGLAHAPALILPTELAIKRSGSKLLLAATLSVFDALPSQPDAASGNGGASKPSDPFTFNRTDGTETVDGLRLAGLMHDRNRSLALIETPQGTDAVEPGGRIDGERVLRIGAQQVTLSAGGTTRVLRWTEDRR